MTKILLHIEGFAVLAFSLYFYSIQDVSWILFFILLFAPDLSMFGYVVNNKIGATMYNLFHTYSLTLVIVVVGLLIENQMVIAIGIIFTAHIGMDRMLGYGLKYPTDFKDTHLNRV